MRLKKSIFSYIIWIIFTVVCCLELIACHLTQAKPSDLQEKDIVVIVGGACAFLLLTAAVFLLLRKIYTGMRERLTDPEKVERVLCVVLPVLLLTGVTAYLVWYVANHIPIMLDDNTFYQLAYVYTDGRALSYMAHGASWLYVCLLHVLFQVFHNTPFAGIVFQIILFFISLMVLYGVMNLLCDLPSAVVSAAFFGFLPVSLKSIFSLTPELFYVMAYLTGLLFIANALRNFKKAETVTRVNYISFFLSGVIAGFLVYLDIFSVSLMFFLAIAVSMESYTENSIENPLENGSGNCRKKRRQAVYANLLSWAGMICGFSLSASVWLLAGETTVTGYITELKDIYFGQIGIQAWRNFPDITLSGTILVVALAFFSVPAFLSWKRYQNSAFLLSLFLVMALSAFSVSVWDYQLMSGVIWCMLAGLGACGVFRRHEEPEEMELQEEAEAEEMTVREKVPAGTKDEIQKTIQKPAPGMPLPNPLPVPKRMKKDKIDFDHQVEEKDMEFDIQVSDQDDFDC